MTISGTGFTPASTVMFGAVTATAVTATSATSITVVVPPGSGTTDVKVQTTDGTSAITPVDEYTYTFSNAGYAIGITASTTSPAANGSVTLKSRSANRDVGPTPYGLSIIDATLGDEVAHAGSGATISFTATQPRVGTHRYVGLISNMGGVNAQALSVPVVVTWGGVVGPPTPASTPDAKRPPHDANARPDPQPQRLPPPPPVGNGWSHQPCRRGATSAGIGQSVTLTGTANRDTGPTPYGLTIFDTTTRSGNRPRGIGFADHATTV